MIEALLLDMEQNPNHQRKKMLKEMKGHLRGFAATAVTGRGVLVDTETATICLL